MPVKNRRSLNAGVASQRIAKSESLQNSKRLNIRLLPDTMERLERISRGDRSEFIRAAIEDKVINRPGYEKRRQQNGGEYMMVRVPEILLLALQSIPVRDRSEFVRQAVDERLDRL